MRLRDFILALGARGQVALIVTASRFHHSARRFAVICVLTSAAL